MNPSSSDQSAYLGFKVNGNVFAHINQFSGEMTALRRELHENPELGFEEVYTSKRVYEALKVCGVDEIHTGIGKTGLVAVINGKTNHQNQMIGLRADMDALPLTENNAFGWKSKKSGLMHACGHDGHTAMLVAAARYLVETRQFDGKAVLIFQPGEEGYAGARAMIEDGLFDRFPVQSVYGMHNWPAMPTGKIAVNPGPMMAASDKLSIVVHGNGGHGAHAYQAIDSVMIAGQIIVALQAIVARNVRPLDNAVISICALQAGDLSAYTVLPDDATLVGTVRTFKAEVQVLLEKRIKEVCQGVAQAFGATVTVKYERGYPATINTEAEALFAARVATGLVGSDNVIGNLDPSMGAEDFSFMLQHKPGAYLRIGQSEANGAGSCFLHNSRYDFNDNILPLGAALHASLVEQAMPLARV